MDVWIVLYADYYLYDIVGVYSDLETAKAEAVAHWQSERNSEWEDNALSDWEAFPDGTWKNRVKDHNEFDCLIVMPLTLGARNNRAWQLYTRSVATYTQSKEGEF
jgi:hypothetical protein